MEVPKLTPTTFEYWHTAFTIVAGGETIISEISLGYLICSDRVGNYNLNFSTREEKKFNWVSINGQRFKTYYNSLYLILFQYIVTVMCGSNIITKYKHSTNIRTFYLEIKSNFHNDDYLQNLTTSEHFSLIKSKYCGERRDFTLETYYNIMLRSFKNRIPSGNTHTLTED